MPGSKFNPKISYVKLNSEQAVLLCACWNTGYRYTGKLYYGPGVVSACNNINIRGGTWGARLGQCSDKPSQQHAVSAGGSATSS